jgi:hypothetical protein
MERFGQKVALTISTRTLQGSIPFRIDVNRLKTAKYACE